MNKKFLVFGLMGLFLMAFAAAALVPYLSNTEEIDMDIQSPIGISEFEGDLDLSYGGEVQTINTELTNLANAQIKGKIKVIITSDDISIEDFDTLTANIVESVPGIADWNSGDVSMLTEGGFIESIDSTWNTLTITTTERTFEIGETWDASIALGFKSNVVGNYNVAVTIVPLE